MTTGVVTPHPSPSNRFVPGAIVAGRYRLVALLGRGGMGEVYRADDLTLDQPVALKFLPIGAAHNESHLAQFHNELRIARQVSHKNVCRLYDLGDADGRRFLTMEYVDGEDLASSLRRFGRIPPDKGLQIARQLCAGVAAAHEKNVLHRDLKPANVMLDGNGDVRITDFGIAAAVSDTSAGLAGTPQYMAPELLAGKAASTKSDIYALGLILFEVFTGKRAFEAKTIGELKALHDTHAVTTPTAIVRELDPAVERVILRCLEKDPERRPASALTVAAALPGGDPVAAALAAGETPSPDMLSAAAETDALPAGLGLAAVAGVAVALLTFAAISGRTSIVGRVPLEKDPAVLLDRADQIIAAVGYGDAPRDREYGLMVHDDYIEWLKSTRHDWRRWDALSSSTPPGIVFWYRTSPRELVPESLDYTIDMEDPPLDVTDMRLVVLDPRGRLQLFRSVPPQKDPAVAADVPRWSALFDAAGLQMSAFSSVAPEWVPPDYADVRMAWEGPLADRPDLRVRVEASAYRGKPVSFSIIGPWTQASRMGPEPVTDVDRFVTAAVLITLVVLLGAAILLARRNFKTGRADRRGASRVGLFVIASGLLVWIAGGHHSGSVDGEFQSLIRLAAIYVLVAAAMSLIYLALEPYVRRFWPDSLLGWSRLIAGHIRDPRVGRDVLIGAGFGVAMAFTELGKGTLLPRLGFPGVLTYGLAVNVVTRAGRMVAAIAGAGVGALENALFTLLIFVVLRLLLRRTWLTVAAGVAVTTFTSAIAGQAAGAGTAAVLIFPLVRASLLTFVVVRFGLLATVLTLYFANVLAVLPLRLDISHWAGVSSAWALGLLVLLTFFGFYAARAGQPLLGPVLE